MKLVGADFALKTQFVVLGVIGVSLVSFFAGSAPEGGLPPPTREVPSKESFWVAQRPPTAVVMASEEIDFTRIFD